MLTVLLAQLAGDGPEDPRALGVAVVGDEHTGVGVEPHVGAVLTAGGILRADHHGADLVAGLDVRVGQGLLDRADDAVAHPGGAPGHPAAGGGAAQDSDDLHDLGPAVVGHFQP
jgi:hypothetical protein